jgi:Ion channel
VNDHGDDIRYGLLLAVIVAVYLLSAFTTAGWVKTAQVILFLDVALIAVRTSRIRRRIKIGVFIGVAGASAVAMILTLAVPDGRAAGVAYLWMALVLMCAAGLVLYRVLASGHDVTLQSIFAAISAYMIMGLMFAALYAAISKFDGGIFFADGNAGNIKTFQYFSFTTLTTLGYGDFTAATSGGRALAVMEALFGQIFLATLVARLVSAYRGSPARLDAGEAHVQVTVP